jgi:NTE family protein
MAQSIPARARQLNAFRERTMTIQVNGATKRIGLALSGGGYRATAFHLGVFRELERMGILWKLDLLTCVSGGSIAGAFLAANWGKADTLTRLDEYLRTTSIAVSSFVAGVLDPFESRLDKLAETYDRDLFKGVTLDKLDGGPRLYLNATNLASGNMFFFVTGENKGAEMGEHELGVRQAVGFPLARAVAASSAFPPVFPPLKLKKKDYDVPDVDYVTLTDGGVYDNLGANPLFRDRNDLDYVLVSDAGKPFEIEDRPTEWGSIVLTKALDVTMEQIRGLQFKRLELSSSSAHPLKPLWFSIDSPIGESQPGDAAFASAVSTNLKKLSKAEMDVLTRHATSLLKHRIQTYAPELAGAK